MAIIGTILTQYGEFKIENTPAGAAGAAGVLKVTPPTQYTDTFGLTMNYVDAVEKAALMPILYSSVTSMILDITQSKIRDIQFDIGYDIGIIRHRAETDTLGIYTSAVCSVCEDERALLMASLVRSGDLGSIIAERGNPTPPPTIFPPHTQETL